MGFYWGLLLMGVNVSSEKVGVASYIFGALFVFGVALGGFGLIQMLEALK